jgi:hypothetical protein
MLGERFESRASVSTDERSPGHVEQAALGIELR